mgnify:CR=1 FL=1
MYDNDNVDANQQSMTAINQRPGGAINRAEHFNRSAASLTGTEGAYSHKTLNRKWVELTDRHVNSIYRAFSLDTNRRLRLSDLVLIIESDFYPDYHPLKEYLESLPVWDGTTDHIDRLASTVHVTGCTQELHNRFFKLSLIHI